jgi:hypothetical protein
MKLRRLCDFEFNGLYLLSDTDHEHAPYCLLLTRSHPVRWYIYVPPTLPVEGSAFYPKSTYIYVIRIILALSRDFAVFPPRNIVFSSGRLHVTSLMDETVLWQVSIRVSSVSSF